MMAAWPTTVTRSRWPRAFALRTQKPLSGLWNVTRSTRPASTSWVDGSGLDFIGIAESSVSLLALRLWFGEGYRRDRPLRQSTWANSPGRFTEIPGGGGVNRRHVLTPTDSIISMS